LSTLKTPMTTRVQDRRTIPYIRLSPAPRRSQRAPTPADETPSTCSPLPRSVPVGTTPYGDQQRNAIMGCVTCGETPLHLRVRRHASDLASGPRPPGQRRVTSVTAGSLRARQGHSGHGRDIRPGETADHPRRSRVGLPCGYSRWVATPGGSFAWRPRRAGECDAVALESHDANP
jgi:hypothetical protein